MSTIHRVYCSVGAGLLIVVDGKTEVIFIKDYYGPGLSGDHIDLFNKNRLTDFSSWFRIVTGFHIQGFWSDYKKAKAIWFWQMQ